MNVIMAILKLGTTGVYILAFGWLARFALDAPRTVGLNPFLIDLFFIAAAAIIALLIVQALVQKWVANAPKGQNRQLLAEGKRQVREKLFKLGAWAAFATVVVVGIDHIAYLEDLTVFHVMLVLASLPSSLVAESIKEAFSV